MKKCKITAVMLTFALTVPLTACNNVKKNNDISPIIQTASAETVTENRGTIPETASAAAETELTESDELDEEVAETLCVEFAKYIGETDPIYARFDPSYVRIDTYYGTYNGCEVFLPLYKSGYDEAIELYYVAGYEIYFPCLGYDIYVHRDGTFYELSEAYEKGYISEEDVAEIAEIQNGMPPEKKDPPEANGLGGEDRKAEKLRREKDNELRRKFIEFLEETDPDYIGIDPSTVKLESYYGIYSGWEAFLPLYKSGYEEAEDRFSFAGHEMYFPCLGYEIYVHKDGEFLKLEDAYEKGFISEADAAQIAEANHIRYFYAFQ